jgi:hypothetical protein
MRRCLVLALTGAVLAAGCSNADSPTGPTFAVHAQGLGNDPDRIRIHEHHTQPFSEPAQGCVEPVLLTGTIHTHIYAQDNPGGRVHYSSHTNVHGVTGVGVISGNRYHLTNVFNAVLNYEFLETKFETNQVFRYRVIGQRPNNNFFIDISYHLTITPDGRVTASHMRVDSHCAQDG